MNLESILNKASLTLNSDNKGFRVYSSFNFFNKSNIGLLLILLLSLTLGFIGIFKSNDFIVQVFLIVLSLIVLVVSLLTIIKQTSDFLEVSDGKLKFSNNLKKKEFSVYSDFKIKVKSDIVHVKTKRGTKGSYFCIVELFLKINGKKYRILDYQVDEKDSKEGKFLGKEIKQMILDKTNKV